MRKSNIKTLIYLFVACTLFGLGCAFVYFKLPPYQQLAQFKKLYASSNNKITLDATCIELDGKRVIDAGDYIWEMLTDTAQWAPRDGAGSVVMDGKMLLIGGWNPDDSVNFPKICNNEVWQSSDGKNWELIKPNTFYDQSFDPLSDWEGRHTFGCVIFDNHIWIVGGDPIQGKHQHDVWKSRDGKDWVLVSDGTDIPWPPRALHMTFVLDSQIFVIGGQTMPKFTQEREPHIEESYYRDIWSTKDGKQWIKHEASENMWRPRSGSGNAVVFKNHAYIVGGFTYDNYVNQSREAYSSVWRSADGVHWEKIVDTADWAVNATGFQYHDVEVFDGKIWIVGGYREGVGNTNELWYSEDGIEWKRLNCSPFLATHATSLFFFQESLIIAAGNHMTKEVWQLRKKDTLLLN